MTQFKGIQIPTPIVKTDSALNQQGTHHSIFGVGGYMEVKTITDRNAIPTGNYNFHNNANKYSLLIYGDAISSGQRRYGMLVYVIENNTIYQLKPINSTTTVPYTLSEWNALTDLEKYQALNDNNGWVVFSLSGSSSDGGEKISKTFSKSSHGFSVGNVVGFNGTSIIRVVVDDYINTNIPVLGVVSEIISSDDFVVTYSGIVNLGALVDNEGNAITTGSVYYLSESVLSNSRSNVDKDLADEYEVKIPVYQKLDASNNYYIFQHDAIVKYLTESDFLNYYTIINNKLDDAITGGTNLSYFEGNYGVQTLTVSYNSNSGYVFSSLYDFYYRDSSGFIRKGLINGAGYRGYFDYNNGGRSFIYNFQESGSITEGWYITTVDIRNSVGQPGNVLSYTNTAYTNNTFIVGSTYNNGGNMFITNIDGNINTGNPFKEYGFLYAGISDNLLRVKRIESNNTSLFKVVNEDDRIVLSANTENISNVMNVSNGLKLSGTTAMLGGNIIGSVTFTDVRDTKKGLEYASDYSSTYTSRSLVDKGYVDSRFASNVIVIVQSTTTEYSIDNDSVYFVGYNAVDFANRTVFLPPNPITGREIIVANLTNTPDAKIFVNGNGKLILNYNLAIIDTAYGSITFLYNGIFWSVTAFTSTPNYENISF